MFYVYAETLQKIKNLDTCLHHNCRHIEHLVTKKKKVFLLFPTWPRSAVGNVSGYRCVSDCNSRGREFDPGQVPYFRGD